MIKKIICPFDFSPTAYNGAEYAAKLACDMHAEILFVNMQQIIPVAAAVSMGEGIGYGAQVAAHEAQKTLETLCSSVKRTFRIPADYEVDITMSSFVNVLTSADLNEAMIVMGTNGADTFYQGLFGSNSYNTLKKAECPVMIVPKGTTYRSISNVVIGWDYTSAGISRVVEMLMQFNAVYTFVHVEKKNEKYNLDKIKGLRRVARDIVGDDTRVRFEVLPREPFVPAMNHYMDRTGADLMAISYHSKSVISQLIDPNHTRELAEGTQYPLLVMPVDHQ